MGIKFKNKSINLVSFKTGKLDSNAMEDGGKFPFFTCSQDTFRINNYAFDTECVLLAGNNAAGVFPLKYYSGKFNAYQRTYVIESLDKSTLDIKYFYYFLRPLLEAFKQQATGATTKFLTLKILHNLDITYPIVLNQRKIAAVLTAYDDLIETNKKRIEILEKMAEELYREWFVRMRFPGYKNTKFVKGVPEGWQVKKLGDIAELIYGKALKESDREPGPYNVYGSGGIVGSHSKALVEDEGIIVGRKGNVGSVYFSDRGFFPIDTVYYIRSELPLTYLFFVLKGMNFINNDAAVPGLNRNQAYSNELLFPSCELIGKFSENVSPIFKLVTNFKRQTENLTKTRDLLLPRLISGKLSVDDLDIKFPSSMREEEVEPELAHA